MLRFRVRTLMIFVAVVAWLLMLYLFGRTFLACVFLIGLALLGLPVNTSGRYGDDPTHPLTVLQLFFFLVLPPLIPFSRCCARKWRNREWP